MKKRNLNNKELDAIGNRLLDAAKTDVAGIEKIVSAPHLFTAINARILAQRLNDAAAEKPLAKRASGLFPLKTFAAAFGVLAVLVSVFAYIATTQHLPEADIAVVLDPPVIDQPMADIPQNIEPVIQHISKNETRRAIAKPVVKTKRSVRPQPKQIEISKEFYALNFSGDPDQPTSDGRIVRVDMPRSSLYALGVDLPLENEAMVLKTELLVGSDGVARAIRFVE